MIRSNSGNNIIIFVIVIVKIGFTDLERFKRNYRMVWIVLRIFRLIVNINDNNMNQAAD